MKWKERPCTVCRQGMCEEKDCQRWQVWFLEAWEQVNRKAAEEIRRQNRLPEGKLLYGLPHEAVDPCRLCPAKRWCDTPCQRRLWWWDNRMEKIRRRIAQ